MRHDYARFMGGTVSAILAGIIPIGLMAHPGHVHGPDTHSPDAVPLLQQQEEAAEEPAPPDHNMIPDNPAQPRGGLNGASIFVSPGHGWLYNERLERWVTQRGVSHGVIEDFSNAEAVLQYLIPYLENAGATVYTTRERNLNPNRVIVSEPELEGPWTVETIPGTWQGLQYTAPTTADHPTASATFIPDIPEDGHYAVYAWYRPSVNGDTSVSTDFQIRHSGGETVFRQNQNLDSRTWKYLGTYYFEEGRDRAHGSVRVDNATGYEDQRIAVDAIRFGGGMSPSMFEGKPLDAPLYEQSGLYTSQYYGFRPEQETRAFNSVSAMPMWSEWEAEAYQKGRSAYVSWHSNANGGRARGMSTFIYGPNRWDPINMETGEDYGNFTGYPGGKDLAILVHNRVLYAVRGTLEPDWRNFGIICRWLGETNPRNNNKMPAALFEYGFHDNVDDAALILNPEFRNVCARATYQGIVEFFAAHKEGFDNDTFLPEPPTHLTATTTEGYVTISWNPPPHDEGEGILGHPATGYLVHRSSNGKGFDNGVPTNGTSMTIGAPAPGQTVFYRVAATNAGGVSWPSETLAVTGAQNGQRVLIVSGFDRLDSGLNLVQPNGGQRGILEKMNTFDYTIQHASAVAAAGFGADSVSKHALTAEHLDPERYAAVVWILGQQKGGDGALALDQRHKINNYLSAGGRLFISGSELASDLAERSGGPEFLSETLSVQLAAGNAEAHTATPVDGSILAGLEPIEFDDGTGRTYPVQAPDVLEPVGNAEAILAYGDGAAAIAYAGNHRVVYLGFPFETIMDDSQRAEVMTRALDFLTGEPRVTAMTGK